MEGRYPRPRERELVKRGQILEAVVIDVKKDVENDNFTVELSARPGDLDTDDLALRRIKHDECWEHEMEAHDIDVEKRKKNAESKSARRIIKHPNFHNFSSQQAEVFLEDQHPGEVVVRPSSKGADHLAVTWKVAEGLYQHVGESLFQAVPMHLKVTVM